LFFIADSEGDFLSVLSFNCLFSLEPEDDTVTKESSIYLLCKTIELFCPIERGCTFDFLVEDAPIII
jgi:hypothetical protein